MQLNRQAAYEALCRFGDGLVNALLPPQCVHCGTLVGTPGGLCGPCWSRLELISRPVCDRTGLAFAFDPGPGIVSARALADPPEWDRLRAVSEFDDVSRALIHALKYYDRHEVVKLMGTMMAQAGKELLNEADMIIPVPLYRLRQWQRRFNQAILLADEISAASGVCIAKNVLKRVRSTPQQVGLKKKQRRDNLKGAFEVDASAQHSLYGKKIVLVDDVMTTGATATACSKVLRKAGCEQINVVVFALVNNRLHRQN